MRLYYHNAYGYNFGDALSPEIANKIARKKVRTLNSAVAGPIRKLERNIFALGSIFHQVLDGDVVWGSGVNPTYPLAPGLQKVDIRAVRGPLTREYLVKERGLSCPEVYGDPALLLPMLLPLEKTKPTRKYIVVPHYLDIEAVSSRENVVTPNRPWQEVVSSILESELVIASSLHGLIVAEAFGIPARWLHHDDLPSNHTESTFKYNDYYASTNRSLNDWASSIDEALEQGGKEPIRTFDYQKLLQAFPHDKLAGISYYSQMSMATVEDLIRRVRPLKLSLEAKLKARLFKR